MSDKPMAAHGFTSYRYRGRWGWVMIGARTHDEALREARRSIDETPDPEALEVWTGAEWAQVGDEGRIGNANRNGNAIARGQTESNSARPIADPE